MRKKKSHRQAQDWWKQGCRSHEVISELRHELYPVETQPNPQMQIYQTVHSSIAPLTSVSFRSSATNFQKAPWIFFLNPLSSFIFSVSSSFRSSANASFCLVFSASFFEMLAFSPSSAICFASDFSFFCHCSIAYSVDFLSLMKSFFCFSFSSCSLQFSESMSWQMYCMSFR
jgi:hypothetical protein